MFKTMTTTHYPFSIYKLAGLLFLMIFCENLRAQTIQGQLSNVCPGRTITYSYPIETACSVYWNVSNGTPSNQRKNTAGTISYIDVVWQNTPSGYISASPSGCSTGFNSQTVSITYVATPSFPAPNPRFIVCGAGSTTITASSVPNATSYIWTLPAGFSASSLSTSTPSITVSYTATASGTITVKGNNSVCNYSGSTASLAITRTPGLPTLATTDTRTELCSGDSRTYTVTPPSGVPANYGYNWYATGGLLINGVSYTETAPLSTTSTTVTISAPTSAYGSARVYVRLNNGVCAASAWRSSNTVQVGTYSSSQFAITSSASQYCPGQIYSFAATTIGNTYQFDGVTNFYWQWPSDWTYLGGQGTQHLDLQAPYGSINYSAVALRITNRCGQTGSAAVRSVSQSGSCGFGFTVQPNPANEYFEVVSNTEQGTATMTDVTGELDETIEIKLFDKFSTVVKSMKSKNKKTKIDTRNLTPGTYYLHIIRREETIRQQVIIQK